MKETRMTKWEYLTFARMYGAWSDDKFDGRTPQEKLTDIGKDGWELISVCYDGSGYHFYLKRAVEAKRTTTTRKSKAKTATKK